MRKDSKEQCRLKCDQTDYIHARQKDDNGVYLVLKWRLGVLNVLHIHNLEYNILNEIGGDHSSDGLEILKTASTHASQEILHLGKFISLRHLRVDDGNSFVMLDLLDHQEHPLDDLIGHDTRAGRRAEKAEDDLQKILWTQSVGNRSQSRYLAAQHDACHGSP